MLYKVSEIAKELNLSKVSVYNRINSLQEQIKPYTRHKKGIMLIDDKGLLILKKSYGLRVDENALNDTETCKASKQDIPKGVNDIETLNKSIETLNKNLNSEYIQSLKSQVEDLKIELDKRDQQIIVKDHQIEVRDQQIDHFQVMLQSANDRAKKIDLFLTEWQQDHQEQDHQEDKKKGLFSRLFR